MNNKIQIFQEDASQDFSLKEIVVYKINRYLPHKKAKMKIINLAEAQII